MNDAFIYNMYSPEWYSSLYLVLCMCHAYLYDTICYDSLRYYKINKYISFTLQAQLHKILTKSLIIKCLKGIYFYFSRPDIKFF